MDNNKKKDVIKPEVKKIVPVPILSGLDEIVDNCERRLKQGDVLYGIEILDDCVETIRDGSCTYIIAAPNTGKSLFGLTIASNLAQQGKDVLICSCEMGAGLLMERQLKSLTGMSMKQFNKLYEDRKSTAEKVLNDIIVNDSYAYLQRIFIAETGGATIDDLIAMFDIYDEYKYIVVDYIQRIRGIGTEYEIISNAAGTLQAYARRTKKKFIICSQANRQSNLDATSGKGIQTNRIRGKGSGSIEEDGDVGLSLIEDPESSINDKRYILATLFKNRYGDLKNITYKYELTKRMALVLASKAV